MLSEERKQELIRQAIEAANKSKSIFEAWLYTLSPHELNFIVSNAMGRTAAMLLFPETNNPFES